MQGPEMSLAELLAHADRHSPLLDVAERQLAYGKAARDAAEPLLLDNPRLDLGIGPRFRGGDRDYDFVASLEQPLALAGAASKTRDAAERLDRLARANLTVARFEVRRAITLAYRRATLARRRIDVARRMKDFEQRLLDVAQQRLAAGDVSIIEVRMAQVDAAEASQRALSAELELRSSRLLLAELSGHSLTAPPNVPPEPEKRGAVPPLDTLLRMAHERHPELARAKARTSEAAARESLAESQAWPKATLGVSFQREGASLVELPAYILLGRFAIELPVFQRNQAERGRASADRDVARGQEALVARGLDARIARARLELLSAEQRLSVQAAAVATPLEDNLTLLQRGFAAGEISLMDVAVAREHFLRAQEVALEAEGDYLEALSALETALGGELSGALGGGR